MVRFLILIWLSFDKWGQFGWRKKKMSASIAQEMISLTKKRDENKIWNEKKKNKTVQEALILIRSDYGVGKLATHRSAIS